MNSYLKASRNPLDDINAVAYKGQSPASRMYKSGYEKHFELLPVLTDDDQFLDLKTAQTAAVMDDLATRLAIDPWTPTLQPLTGGFNRTILALEQPVMEWNRVTGEEYDLGNIKEGAEIIVARWGDGFSSPVHGHADGYLYEQLIAGTMRVNTYRITDPVKRIARPVETKIYKDFQNIASQYTPRQTVKRGALVHNFTSIGYSVSLHYVPEHTRDGRDNRFTVEYFEKENTIPLAWLTQLTAQEGIEQLHIGDVALVRSANVPEYGDHYIVITGKPILKEHGLRPQDVEIHAPHAGKLLDQYDPIMGLTLLKLSPYAKKAFHEFHGIAVDGDRVIFPKA